MKQLILDDSYREFFVLDNAETETFHMMYPTKELLKKLGIWFNIFDYMFKRTWNECKTNNNIHWDFKVLTLDNSKKFAKELLITVGNDTVKVTLYPHYYFDKKMYNELQFAISAKRQEAILLLHLYADTL